MQIYLNIIAKVGPGPGMQHDWLLLLRWPDRGVEVLATLYSIHYTLVRQHPIIVTRKWWSNDGTLHSSGQWRTFTVIAAKWGQANVISQDMVPGTLGL